jgi:hypothetical protein
MILNKIEYSELNAKQKESYNFQKVSSLLADYGYTTLRLSDDWQGADFIAQHTSSDFIKVQLKGRLEVNRKYTGKDIFMCFRYKENWYLGPHDEILGIVEARIEKTASWTDGKYTWNIPSKKLLSELTKYIIS